MSGIFRINGYNSVRRINSKKPASGAVSWWLAGGIAPANVYAAYQTQGVLDKSTSFINLANPGAYNLGEVGEITFSDIDGWGNFSRGINYLTTGISIPNEQKDSFTFIVKYSAPIATYVLECNNRYFFQVYTSPGNRIRFFYGSNYSIFVPQSGSVGGNTTIGAYADGVRTSDLIAAHTNINGIVLGNPHDIANVPYSIYSCAFYRTNITADQYVAVSTAMNAL